MIKINILSNDIGFIRSFDSLFDKVDYKIEKLSIKPEEVFNYICKNPTDFILIQSTFLKGYYQLIDMLLNANKCSVIYITPNLEDGALFNAMSSPRFYMISSNRISSIPDLIPLMERDRKLFENVNNSLDAYKDKINEERLVRKAKLYLMNEYNIDEEEAYKKILRKSMDERISKLQAAKNILGGR